ncbi:uncharacterized protein [Argopecten irradians]|uniref:uncharacterized protein isoform X2 n=1 Tax=Argopecten irradians TaxID=31199 RepID=UPI00372214E0
MSDPGQQGMFYSRMITGLTLTVLSLVFLTIADVSIAVKYENILADDDTACSLKAAYSMFIITTIIEFVIAVYDTSLLCILLQTGSPTTCCDCYNIQVTGHFFSCILLFIGVMIYGIKDPEMVGYSFWLALTAGLLTLANTLMWLITQKAKKLVFKSTRGVNVRTIGKTYEVN